METQSGSHDPGRILAQASPFLWKYWRQYGLTPWEDAESILRRLTMLLRRQTGFSSYTLWMDPPAAAGIIAEWQKAAKDLTGTEVHSSERT